MLAFCFKKLNFEFNDTDKIIENELKLTIAEIFKIKGENFFREMEEKITLKNKKKENYNIISGGAL